MKRTLVVFCILVPHFVAGLPIGVLKYSGGDWYSCVPSVKTFIARFRSRHPHISLSLREEGTAPDERDFFHSPFYILNGHGKVLLSNEQVSQLRLFLDKGGFLFANDDYGMDASFRKLIRRLYPGSSLVRLNADHDIFRCWYDLPGGIPKIHKHDGGDALALGLYREGRLVVFYAYNTDILDGWDKAEVHRDPESTREQAFRMGCNIIYYAMTR